MRDRFICGVIWAVAALAITLSLRDSVEVPEKKLSHTGQLELWVLFPPLSGLCSECFSARRWRGAIVSILSSRAGVMPS